MKNLRQAFMTTAWRGLKGMLCGAATGGVMFVAICGLACGLQFLFGNYYSRLELKDVLIFLPGAALVGVLVGSVAGLAAGLPRKGVDLLKSIGVVAGCGFLGVVLAAPARHYKGEPEPSPNPIVIAAVLGLLLGGAFVLAYGIAATTQSNADDVVGEDGPNQPSSSQGERHE